MGVLVSVIIPTYNRASLISDAIQSVLNQTYSDYEIIVVDDGSTDNTHEIVAQCNRENIHYFYQDNQGVSVARNRGIREAQGKYIAFLDSDDLFLPQKLDVQVRLLEQKPTLGMAYTSYIRTDEAGNPLEILPARPYPGGYKEMLLNCRVATPTVMVSRIALDQVGGFDETMHVAEDVDLWCRIYRFYPVEPIQEPLAKVRLHNGSTSRDPIDILHAYMYLLVKAFRADRSLSWPYKRKALAKMHYTCAIELLNCVDSEFTDPGKYSAYHYYYLKSAHYWPFTWQNFILLWNHYTRGPRESFNRQRRNFLLKIVRFLLPDILSDFEMQYIKGRAFTNLELGDMEEIAAWLARQFQGNEAYPIFYKHGFHLLRRHYYLPIPEEEDRQYLKSSALPGIRIDDSVAFDLLEQAVAPYKAEFNQMPVKYKDTQGEHEFYLLNSAFMAIDGNVYYGLIRHYKPRRIIEIGSGFSTLLAAAANRKNIAEGALTSEITCIEPYPSEMLYSLKNEIRLLPKKVQEIGIDLFASLGMNDILFIDSSHTLREGGDVWYEYCEILPRLSPGVLVHIHDISLPKPYQDVYFARQVYWNEQYLLQAFLTHNHCFDVIWPGNYLMLKYPERMQQGFAPEYDLMRAMYPSSEPSSFWMRVHK